MFEIKKTVMIDSLGIKEVSPHHCQIMVAERKGVDRLIPKNQHTRRCPLPFYRRGDEGTHKKIDF
jgi:hypothetical protein